MDGCRRGFDISKILKYSLDIERIPVTHGQLIFEYKHLLKKLKKRNTDKYLEILNSNPIPHPIFYIIQEM